jgi:hypothetical protein
VNISNTHSDSNSPEVEIHIPDELVYFLTETAKDLGITPDELVRQAVSSYCREMKGRRHE